HTSYPVRPYTTLFRSTAPTIITSATNADPIATGLVRKLYQRSPSKKRCSAFCGRATISAAAPARASVPSAGRSALIANRIGGRRSEEHTSELQSRENL